MNLDPTPRLERDLPAMFDELAAPRTPDYLEAAIERASSRSQRPAWTFPERWLPMDIVTRPVDPRSPMRAIGILALIGVLIAAGLAAAYIGSSIALALGAVPPYARSVIASRTAFFSA